MKHLSLFFLILHSFLFSLEVLEEIPINPPPQSQKKEYVRLKNARIELRHRDGSGIGYNQGYTTLSLFYAPYAACVFPFVDGRFHVFNNGRYAANAGLGLRDLMYDKYVLGFNAYYDYRKSRVLRLHQVAAGLEFLTKNTGLFLNGYLPFGDKRFDNPREFDHFSGRNLFVSQKRKAALAHVDALLRYTVTKNDILSASPAIGGYYLAKRGRSSRRFGNAFGVKGEFSVHIYKIFSMGVDASYDKIFKTRVEGFVNLTIPLGLQKCRKEKNKCKALDTFVRKDVQRDEIIPLEDKTFIYPLINSVTNEPYLFTFVNNGGQSNGTFESPFPSISTAVENSTARDIVYVFPGTGQAYGQVFLQNWLTLQGSGHSFTLEDIVIPALTADIPFVNAGSSQGIIIPADNTIINGFNVGNAALSGDGIRGIGRENVTIKNCNIAVRTTSQGLELTGKGNLTVTDCQVNAGFTNPLLGIFLSATGDAKLDIQNNTSPRGIAISGSVFNVCTRFKNNNTLPSGTYNLQNMTIESPDGTQSGLENINQGNSSLSNVTFITGSCPAIQ